MSDGPEARREEVKASPGCHSEWHTAGAHEESRRSLTATPSPRFLSRFAGS